MLRILVVEPAGNLWGSERALLDLLDGLNRSGATEVAVCLPPSTLLEPELRLREIAVYPYLRYALHLQSRWRRAQAALGVLRASLAFHPDLIYLNQAGVYRIALPAAVLGGLGIVAHVRLFEDAAYLASCTPSPSRLRGIVAISSAIEQEIRGQSALAAIPIHKLYDAYAPSATGWKRAASGRAKRIACVGRIVPIKGQDVLVSAMAAVRDAHPDVECLMIGDGDPSYMRMVKDTAAPLRDSVKWVGFQSDVQALLQTCNVLVCPSWREPLGRVVLESWDAGVLPVVFRGSGGASEMLINAKGGFCYDEQDPAALAQAIIAALSLGTDEREGMINSGRAWLASNCDPALYSNAMIDILGRNAR